MTGPDISPILARIGGDGYRDQLKQRLLQLADETDDPAYARRLRQVAEGSRPLRALAMDPAWNKQFPTEETTAVDLPDLDAEQRKVLADRVEALRNHIPAPSNLQEATSLIREVVQRAELTRQIVREDEIAGWDYLPPKPDSSTTQG